MEQPSGFVAEGEQENGCVPPVPGKATTPLESQDSQLQIQLLFWLTREKLKITALSEPACTCHSHLANHICKHGLVTQDVVPIVLNPPYCGNRSEFKGRKVDDAFAVVC